MKYFFLVTAFSLFFSNHAIARDFDMDTLDYKNIKDGPDSPIETKSADYPVFMSVKDLYLVIENKSNKPVEVNGYFFDSLNCDVDLPNGMFRLPVGGRFVTSIAHCSRGSMKYGYLNVGKYKKKFNLINWGKK